MIKKILFFLLGAVIMIGTAIGIDYLYIKYPLWGIRLIYFLLILICVFLIYLIVSIIKNIKF